MRESFASKLDKLVSATILGVLFWGCASYFGYGVEFA